MAKRQREQRARAARRNGGLPAGAVAAVALLGLVGALALILISTRDGQPSPTRPAEARPHTAERDGLALGPAHAPVTIQVYADFQCPYCGRLAREVLPRLEEAYVETGKARLVFHNFAFLGNESVRAAEAAYCAEEQGRFWEYHDMLFANQDGENRGAFSDGRLKEFAQVLGLEAEPFNQCLDAGRHRPQVQADSRQAETLGIRSTPTVIINGQRIEGLGPYRAYQEVIEKELSP